MRVSVADTCYVTCPKTRLKVILQYHEEGWLGKQQNRAEGVIFTYDPNNDTTLHIKDVCEKDVLARIEGCWTDKVYFTLGSEPFAKSKVHSLTSGILQKANPAWHLGQDPLGRRESIIPCP